MFYAGSVASLKQELESCFKHKLGPGKLPNGEPISQDRIVTLVCPHAGYKYSGPVAATSYYELAGYRTPDNIVIIGPNHTGMGSAISLMNQGKWSTPLGEIQINTDLADSIIKNSTIVDVEEEAHIYEHSIEVQLPFLQYIYGNNFSFVPICMMMQDLKTSRELGEAIHKSSNGLSTIIRRYACILLGKKSHKSGNQIPRESIEIVRIELEIPSSSMYSWITVLL